MFIQTLIFSLACFFAADVPLPEWDEAVRIAEEHGAGWAEVFESLDVDPRECEAVVFPELMRYGRVRDGIEHGVLLAPYMKKGIEGANFSVGMFQMKPSFAEQVEAAWMQSGMRHEYELYFVLADTEEVRRRRVERLGDERWQCVYLAVFVRLMTEREPELLNMDPEDRVALLATAYNYSFTASLDELETRRDMKTFHLDFIRTGKTVLYSYSSLAVRRFRESGIHL